MPPRGAGRTEVCAHQSLLSSPCTALKSAWPPNLHQTPAGLGTQTFLLLTLGIRKGERLQPEAPQRRRSRVWAHLFISHRRAHVCRHFQRIWCYWPPKHPLCRGTGSLDSQVPLLTEKFVRLRSFSSAFLGSPKNLQWWLCKRKVLWCWQVIRRKRSRTAIKTVEAMF